MKVILETAAMVLFGAWLVGTLILGTGGNTDNTLKGATKAVMQENIKLIKAVP